MERVVRSGMHTQVWRPPSTEKKGGYPHATGGDLTDHSIVTHSGPCERAIGNITRSIIHNNSHNCNASSEHFALCTIWALIKCLDRWGLVPEVTFWCLHPRCAVPRGGLRRQGGTSTCTATTKIGLSRAGTGLRRISSHVTFCSWDGTYYSCVTRLQPSPKPPRSLIYVVGD